MAQTQLPDHHPSHVVCVGASAGGLEAIEALFETMPEDTGMAFVVVQHLSPDFKSHMQELLSRKTRIPVHMVEDGMLVEANRIYLIPAKKEMVIAAGRLRLTERSKDRSPAHPVDQFLRSMATDVGRFSVAVVLSGTGSDGSRGVKDVHGVGGLVIVQDERTAKFDGMPLNAQATGAAHLVLPPAAMSEALSRYAHGNLSPEALAREELKVATTGIDGIFDLLRRSNNVDFSHYKASTVGRRVRRRMQLIGSKDMDSYCKHLEDDAAELEELYHDLLIGVTHFFRDPEAYEYLEQEVLPELIGAASDGDTIRAWVAGCASGEEAYSIAILLDEAARREDRGLSVKVFATDIHQRSLEVAGAGCYPEESVQGMAPERLTRYFEQRKGTYRVSKHLRNLIVFAPHNVFSDAPFIQLDLITCRNLLIYLQPHAQKKALSLFHFGLEASGILVLGTSETPGDLSDEFESLNNRWRIFRKRRDVRLPIESRLPFPAGRAELLPAPSLRPRQAPAVDTHLLSTYDRLLETFMPPSILLDEDHNVVHAFEGAQRFLHFRAGRASSNVLDVVEESLRTPLIGALQHAIRDQKEVRYSGVTSSTSEGEERLELVVTPLHDQRTNVRHYLVQLLSAELPAPPVWADKEVEADQEVDVGAMSRERIESLETELRFTRENLQATIEELQAANEEMQASNEELQSTNEELQSVNQELYTVNTEHQQKLDELTRAHDDMDNLLALTRVGVIFLDEDRCIRRFTPEIGKLFHMLPQDLGRPFKSFERNFAAADLGQEIDRALGEDVQRELRVVDRNGRPYLVRIAPYQRTETVSGAALTFIDVDDLESAHQEIAKFERMSQQAADMHLLFDGHGNLKYANRSTAQCTGHSAEELVGRSIDVLEAFRGDHEPARLLERLRKSGQGTYFEEHMTCRDGSRFPVAVTASVVEHGGDWLVFAAARDTTRRKAAEHELRLFKTAVDSVTTGITIADALTPDYPLVYVNDGFVRMTGFAPEDALGRNCRFLQGDESSEETRRILREALRDKRPARAMIRNYRQDGSGFWNDLHINPIRNDEGRVTHFVGIQNDVTESIERTSEMRNREARMRTLLDSTIEGILGLDTAGRCVFCNASAVELLGLAQEDQALGRSLAELIDGPPNPRSRRKRLSTRLRAALEERSSLQMRGDRLWRRDGSSFPVNLNAHAIREEDHVLGHVVTFVDTSDDAKQRQRLRQARLDADAASRAKSEFLANMSHEIRTPLAAIMAFVDLLALRTETSGSHDQIAGIKRNAAALLDIVNDILDLSRVEADRLQVQLEQMALADLVDDVNSAMALRASGKGLYLDFDCRTPIPRTIRSDRTRLRQILLNLVGNAIKFTEAGGVNVILSHDRRASMLQIDVTDTGIGVSDDLKTELFKPFRQADPSIERRFGGTGLGLSITKRLIEKLDGSIELKSEEGVGSTFRLLVPTGEVDADDFIEHLEPDETLHDPLRTQDMPRLEGVVLMVDDQPDIRETASKILESVGARVICAASADEVEEALATCKDDIDVILLDLQMPVRSGFDTLKHIRSTGFDRPVVAFTAQAMKGEEERCLKEGFDDYISKPIDTRKMLDKVSSFLSNRANENGATRVLIVEDHVDAAQSLAMLLQLEGWEVRIAATGAEALEAVGAFVPHACLIDLGLPDMDGHELVGRLREVPALARTRFVAATGRDPSAAAAGGGDFDAHMTKPLDPARIVEFVKTARNGD